MYKRQGYVNDMNMERLHHEIYLSDARKVVPEKWKTVIRPVSYTHLGGIWNDPRTACIGGCLLSNLPYYVPPSFREKHQSTSGA